jgi:hypothetical protein
MEKARIVDSKAEGTALPCEAWMHFAGGETSAERPGTTWMMFLAIFLQTAKVLSPHIARIGQTVLCKL